MGKHEQKKCLRCGGGFECKVGDILKCQCYAIKLNDAEVKFIETKFTDCLCSSCMRDLKSEYRILQMEIELRMFFGR
jgi:hypothetical protein